MAQLGRALRSGRRGRRFESCHFDFNPRKNEGFFVLINQNRYGDLYRKCCCSSYDFLNNIVHCDMITYNRRKKLKILEY